MAESDGWKSCDRSYGPASTGLSPCCVFGYRRATAASARSAFRASATAWSRWRCSWCWVPSSKRISWETKYGFRPKKDAKTAIRHAFWHVTDHGRREVVDADLSDYFTSIPHGPLMRCVSRRIADGTLLSVIKLWLTAPVVERTQRATRTSREARDRHRGTPQGSPISPLLANLYFRRFVLAWERFGHRAELDAYVVNYADDLIICCRPGNGATALVRMRQLMTRLGLTVNEAKTRLALLPEESFDFLGLYANRFGRTLRPPFLSGILEIADELVSRPAGLHRQSLAERCVRLSTHTAPIRQTHRSFRCASVRRGRAESEPVSPGKWRLRLDALESA